MRGVIAAEPTQAANRTPPSRFSLSRLQPATKSATSSASTELPIVPAGLFPHVMLGKYPFFAPSLCALVCVRAGK